MIMESSKKITPVLTVSSVAMIIGIIMRQVEWSSLLPQRGSQIFSSSISGYGPWWSFSPVLFVFGAIHGALLAGLGWRRFCNRLGMVFFDAILIVGLFAVSFPVRSTELMVVGRLLLGTGSGGLSAIVPAYVGEISHPKFRGRLSALFPMIMVMGVMISDVFGPFKQYDYQQPFNISFNVFCCSIIILHAIGLYFDHKSLHSSSRSFFEQHHHNIYSLNAINLLSQHNWIKAFFLPSMSCFDNCYNAFRRSSWHGLDASHNYRTDFRALFIGVGCMFFHQMCGINVMVSYMIHTIKMADIHVDPKTVFITLEIVQVIVMCIAIIIIDSRGRRILLISSAVIMCFCFASLAFCNFFKMQLNATTLNNISMICIMFFILAYSLGFGPVPWVIVGEIFSMKVKPYGVSLATAINWLMMLAGAYFPNENNTFLEIEYVFLVRFVLCLFGALFAWWFIPETKKISLTQIQLEIDANFEVISYIPV
ncbi:unnamed protein product [Aphis gossypii]|uniref:Major facilitator superfamily (MFS) profile domain-containing protein n=1 Tax=Aphis gossypii TaxID=80765 RepID=A0A9P0IIP8_APHGO|nr:unnamed protein product [Aphis gossypii]